ncbi:MAG: hypothetical protein ACI8RD_014458 [Bacillariaceae sp.]|jgi:hypothetical protein
MTIDKKKERRDFYTVDTFGEEEKTWTFRKKILPKYA